MNEKSKKLKLFSTIIRFMEKRKINKVLIVLLVFISSRVFALGGVGTGISVYVPESLYKAKLGSVSLEQSLEFDLKLGNILSIPMGVNYNTNYGLMVKGVDQAEDPWFYSDALMPYVMLKAHIPVGPLFFEVFGGTGINWNITLRAMEGNMESNLSTTGSQAVFSDGTLDFDNKLGFGFLAGGAIGFTHDKISVNISGLYRYFQHDLNLSATYSDFSQVSPGEVYNPGDTLKLIVSGISIGIGGSIALK